MAAANSATTTRCRRSTRPAFTPLPSSARQPCPPNLPATSANAVCCYRRCSRVVASHALLAKHGSKKERCIREDITVTAADPAVSVTMAMILAAARQCMGTQLCMARVGRQAGSAAVAVPVAARRWRSSACSRQPSARRNRRRASAATSPADTNRLITRCSTSSRRSPTPRR